MLRILDIDPQNARIIIVDRKKVIDGAPEDTIDTVDEQYCPFASSWSALGNVGVDRAWIWKQRHQAPEPVLFRRALLPLGNFNHIWGHGELCHGPAMIQQYVDTLRQHFRIIPASPPSLSQRRRLQITLVQRQNKPNGERAGRRVRNWDELIEAISPMYSVQLIDFTNVPRFVDQVRLVSETDILVGMHGAGLTNLLFLPSHAHDCTS